MDLIVYLSHIAQIIHMHLHLPSSERDRKKGQGEEKMKRQHWSIPMNLDIQLTLVISTSLISNNRLSRSENLVPVLS